MLDEHISSSLNLNCFNRPFCWNKEFVLLSWNFLLSEHETMLWTKNTAQTKTASYKAEVFLN